MKGSYDQIAPFYDLLARLVFGRSIVNAQRAFLPQLRGTEHLLVLGGGTGWWLKDLEKINADLKITYVEPSRAMVARAKAHAGNMNVEWVIGTHADIPGERHFDAVAMFFFLDLFTADEARAVVNLVNRHLVQGATVLVCDFVDDKSWQRAFLKVMYLFFRAVTGLRLNLLCPWRKVLQANYTTRSQHQFYRSFIQSFWMEKLTGDHRR